MLQRREPRPWNGTSGAGGSDATGGASARSRVRGGAWILLPGHRAARFPTVPTVPLVATFLGLWLLSRPPPLSSRPGHHEQEEEAVPGHARAARLRAGAGPGVSRPVGSGRLHWALEGPEQILHPGVPGWESRHNLGASPLTWRLGNIQGRWLAGWGTAQAQGPQPQTQPHQKSVLLSPSSSC